nr:epoxide hydrolase 4-like [Rhipicephalus microplus]
MHYIPHGCHTNNPTSPILLLLHGFLDFWFIWNRQIPNLSNHFCVVVPDLRGYGLTTKPTNSAEYLMLKLVEDVKQLINFINPPSKNRQLVLVGHDWGAMIGFCLATLHESLISRMIIINEMHPKAFSKQLLRSPRQMRMSWYMIPFRHPRVPEQYLMMRDFAFFDKVHKVFTEREEYIHKYMFSQPGALTGAINYYRAFNNDKEQLNKLRNA